MIVVVVGMVVVVIVVEGMVMITTDFGLERMRDIGRIERIFHRDFSSLEPMLENNSEIGTKAVAKDSNLAGFENS